jgi:glycosyltransferase involved in cell wall biosynthesis
VRDFWLLDDARVYGGGQRNVLRLARFISSSAGPRTARVVCPADSELAERCHAAGLEVVEADFPDLELREATQIARAVQSLRRVLRGAARDTIIVGFSLRTQVYAHAAIGPLASQRIVHVMVEQDSAERLSAQRLLRRYGAVVVVGERAARAYSEALQGVAVHAVNNFLLREDLTGPERTAHSANDGPPILGVLARLIPEKGILDLVEELAQIPGAWSSLLIGGEHQDASYVRAIEELLAQTALEQRVQMLGNIDDLSRFFAEVEVLVVPSVGNEGQPTVILDALAHGRPVIVRDSISTGEFDGLPVCTYGDAGNLAQTLVGVASAPAVEPADLLDRFGPSQFLNAIEAAAASPRS